MAAKTVTLSEEQVSWLRELLHFKVEELSDVYHPLEDNPHAAKEVEVAKSILTDLKED